MNVTEQSTKGNRSPDSLHAWEMFSRRLGSPVTVFGGADRMNFEPPTLKSWPSLSRVRWSSMVEIYWTHNNYDTLTSHALASVEDTALARIPRLESSPTSAESNYQMLDGSFL